MYMHNIYVLAVLVLLKFDTQERGSHKSTKSLRNQQHWCVCLTADLNIPPKKRMQMHSAAKSQ